MGFQDDGFDGYDADNNSTAITVTNKFMVAAIVVLFTAVFFILGLHIYARCVWGRRISIRRRRLEFVGDQDPARLQRVGLGKSAIEAIPVFVYQSKNHKDGLECAVCLCEFEENEKARLLPKCQHSFHIDCIDMWFHSHSTCPLCRASAQPDTPADSVVVLIADEKAASGSASETDQQMLLPPISEDSASTSMETDLCPSCRHHEVLPTPTYPGHHEVLRSPTYLSNLNLWAAQNRVSSAPNSTSYDHGATSSSRKTLDKIIIDIPRRDDSFSSPRPFSSDDQQVFSPSGQSLKSPGMRLRSLKRILSKGKKIVPQSPDGDRNIPVEQGIHQKTEDS